MLPPQTHDPNPSDRGGTAVSDPPPRMYGSLVPMQIELPQVTNAPWMVPQTAGPGPLPAMSFTFGGALNSFRRRWWSVALGCLTGAAGLALAWVFVPPQIEVESILELSREPTEIGAAARGMDREHWENYKATQAQLVKTRLAIMKALEEKDPDTGRPLLELPVVKAEWDKVGWLQGKIRVWFPGDAAIMVISMKGEDPKQMVKLVNAVTQSYLKEFVTGEQSRMHEKVSTLDAHLSDLKGKLESGRRNYESRAKQLNALDQNTLNVKHAQQTQNLQNLMARLQQQMGKLVDKNIEILGLNKAVTLSANQEPSALEIDEQLHQNQKWIDKTRVREGYLEELRGLEVTNKNKDAPSMKRIRHKLQVLEQELEDLRHEIVPEIRKSMHSDRAAGTAAVLEAAKEAAAMIQEDVTKLEADVAAARRETDGLHNQFAELEALEKNNDSLQREIEIIQGESLNATLNLKMKPGIELYNRASVPEGSVDWMRLLMVTMLAGLGFTLPVFGLVAWDFAQRRLNTSSDLPEALGVKLVGTIPSLNGSAKKKGDASGMLGGRNALADAVDGVRTALMRDAAAESTRIVLVTSPVGREGKTTLATQLAASLGRAGRRTLFIDGDLRNPSAHRVLGVAQDPGLAEILRGEVEIEEAIRPTRANGLWMIPAGNCCEEALHALARDGVQEVFKELSSGFDFVIIDAPPVLTDADALVLGQHVDAAILSVLRDISRVPQVFEARDRLRTVGVRLLGCVYHGAKGERRVAKKALAAK